MAFRTLFGLYVFAICSLFYAVALRRDEFSTKTAYEELGVKTATYDEYWVPDADNIHGCEAVHVAGVFRHGARNPSGKYITSINNLMKFLKNASSTFDLKNWTNPLTESEEKLLNTVGEQEMIDIGKRTWKRLASLFRTVSIKMTSSEQSRALKSGRKFLEGFLPGIADKLNELSVSVHTNNTLLRFYDKCEKYIKSVDDNDTALEEATKFEKGSAIDNLLKRIKLKLGLVADQALELGQVESIYNYCAFETAMYNKSVWCDALQDEDLDVLQYYDDLENYWKEGYAYPINYEMACPLMSHIFEGMQRVVEKGNKHKKTSAEFLFGHSQTIMGLIAALDLYKDTKPLMANNMAEQKNRKIRSNQALPYSANLVFVLYRCNSSENITTGGKTYRSNYVTKLFHNENEIAFPGCTSGICPFDFLTSKYSKEIKCEFEKLCTHVVGSSNRIYLSFVLIVGTVLLQGIL